MIEGSFDIGIDHPFPAAVRASYPVNFLDRVVASSSRSEPVAASLKASLPAWFEGVLDHRLNTAIKHHGIPSGRSLPFAFAMYTLRAGLALQSW